MSAAALAVENLEVRHGAVSAVRGISLPRAEPDAALAVGARRPLRDYVAFVAALAHVAVRSTSTDVANRTPSATMASISPKPRSSRRRIRARRRILLIYRSHRKLGLPH